MMRFYRKKFLVLILSTLFFSLTYYHFKRDTNYIDFEILMLNEEVTKAASLYESLSESDQREAYDYLSEQLHAHFTDYKQGKLTFDEVMENMRLFTPFNSFFDSERSFIEQQIHERYAISLLIANAEQFLLDQEYKEAYIHFQKIRDSKDLLVQENKYNEVKMLYVNDLTNRYKRADEISDAASMYKLVIEAKRHLQEEDLLHFNRFVDSLE
ncbi:hypothetical protein [Pontibacillus halophilus]|nr:hypothetical protein [Pontibacillus halophilus]